MQLRQRGRFKLLQICAQFDAAAGKESRPLRVRWNAPPRQKALPPPASGRKIHRQAPAEMVVAGAGMAHRLVLGTGTRAQMSGPRRHRDQGFDRLAHIGSARSK